MEELEEDALRCGGAGGQRGPDKYATQVTETPRTESQAEGKPAHSHHTSSTSNLTREISATGPGKAQKVPAPDREVCAGAGGEVRRPRAHCGKLRLRVERPASCRRREEPPISVKGTRAASALGFQAAVCKRYILHYKS